MLFYVFFNFEKWGASFMRGCSERDGTEREREDILKERDRVNRGRTRKSWKIKGKKEKENEWVGKGESWWNGEKRTIILYARPHFLFLIII